MHIRHGICATVGSVFALTALSIINPSTSAWGSPVSDTAIGTPAITPPGLHAVYTGPTKADYHDPTVVSALVSDNQVAEPNATVTVTLGAGTAKETCNGVTNSSGIVTCTLSPDQLPGDTYISVRATSQDGQHAGAAAGFTITKQKTVLTYTGPKHIANATTAHLKGQLKEGTGQPVAGRTVTFVLGGGNAQQRCSGISGSDGMVGCDITSVDQPLNDTATVPLAVSFSGDDYYLASDTAATLLLQYATGRAFALSGDVNLLLSSVSVPPTPDTGQIRSASATSTTTPCQAALSALVIQADALCANVTTSLAPGKSVVTSSVANATIGIPGLPVIKLSEVKSTSISTCQGATGSTTLNMSIGGTPVTVPTAPNSSLDLGGGARLTVNEQTGVPGADVGLHVNAVHLTALGGLVDVVVGSSTSDAHNCGS